MQLIACVYLVAIAFVWSRGTIFRPVRERGPAAWRALATCPLCAGFWIGVIGYAVWLSPFRVVIEWLGVGSLVGSLALVVYCVVRRL